MKVPVRRSARLATSRNEQDSYIAVTQSSGSDSDSFKSTFSTDAAWGSEQTDSSSSGQEPYDVEVAPAPPANQFYVPGNSDDDIYDQSAPLAVVEELNWLGIDPTNMSPLPAMLLTDYLMASLMEKRFYLQANHMTQDLAKLYSQYDLLWFSNKNSRNYFAVIGNKVIGHGGNSVVKKVKGLLKPDNGGTFFYKSHKNKPRDKRWAVRFEHHTPSITFKQAQDVFSLVADNERLAIKPPILIDGNTSATIMRLLKDKNLADMQAEIVKDPIGFKEKLKIYRRWDFNEIISLIEYGMLQFTRIELLQYSLAMIEAYIEQVLRFDLLHRDIKPENIIIDLQKGPCAEAVTFVDFAFACHISIGMRCDLLGTAGFAAPEIMTGGPLSGNASDIFALACTLALWYGDNAPYEEIPDDYWHVNEVYSKQFKRLSPETPPEVKDTLHRMVAQEPLRRPSINVVKRAYEEALENERFENALSSWASSVIKRK